mgnify:FL=1
MNAQNQMTPIQSTQLVNDVECVVLVGWGYDLKYMQPWDSVSLRLGSERYYAEPVQREDIAKQLGNEALLESGLLFILPKAAFDGQTSAELMLMDFDNKAYAMERVEILYDTCN